MNRDFADSQLHKARYFNKPIDTYEPYAGVQEGDAEDFKDRPVSEAWKIAALKKKEEEGELPKDACDKDKIEAAFEKLKKSKEEHKIDEEAKIKVKEEKKEASKKRKEKRKEDRKKGKIVDDDTASDESEDDNTPIDVHVKKEENKEEKKDEKKEEEEKVEADESTVKKAKKLLKRPLDQQPHAIQSLG